MVSTADMTTPTSMGNHGGTVTSCSPYAYPGFAEICILLRTWSTVAPSTYELAYLIKKKKLHPQSTLVSLQCDFSRLRTEWSYLPAHARSLASPIQGMPGMAWRGVACYRMAWRERPMDCALNWGHCVFANSPNHIVDHSFKLWEFGP